MVKLKKVKYFHGSFDNDFEQKSSSKVESSTSLELPTTDILLKKQHTHLRLGAL